MEEYNFLQQKSHLVKVLHVFLILLSFNQCHGLRSDFTHNHRREQVSSPGNVDRQGKQLYLPVILWSPLGYLLGNPYSASYNGHLNPSLFQQHTLPFPMYYQYNLHHQPIQMPSLQLISSGNIITNSVSENNGKYPLQTQQLFTREDSPQENHLDHASQDSKMVNSNKVACRMHDKVGICKPFSKCFPMFEMEYGSENYMDSPLAEQMALNTNVTVCAKLEHRQSICCPAAFYKAGFIEEGNLLQEDRYDDDYFVNLPPITQRPPLSLIFSRKLVDNKMCGRSQLLAAIHNNRISKVLAQKGTQKITGGHEAKGPQEFPWMAGIFGRNKKLFCGATLITDQFLLSAAHCFSSFSPADIPHLYVHLGDYNIKTTSDGPHEVRKVDKLIVHKKFRIENYHNDIALVKLDRPVNFTNRIQPVCLPDSEDTLKSLENKNVIVTGWGRKYRYGSLSDVLRKVEMPVWNHNECSRIYATFAPGRLLNSNFCAGDGKRNKDACIGDSGGGAIQQTSDGRWVIQGITSWGKGCGSFPGVYTRVAHHLMWITKHLNQHM